MRKFGAQAEVERDAESRSRQYQDKKFSRDMMVDAIKAEQRHRHAMELAGLKQKRDDPFDKLNKQIQGYLSQYKMHEDIAHGFGDKATKDASLAEMRRLQGIINKLSVMRDQHAAMTPGYLPEGDDEE